jgi:hypothetical protein
VCRVSIFQFSAVHCFWAKRGKKHDCLIYNMRGGNISQAKFHQWETAFRDCINESKVTVSIAINLYGVAGGFIRSSVMGCAR